MTVSKKSAKQSAPESAESAKQSAKPRRRINDWPAIHRDYRTGKYTLRELEDKHGADNALISRKAKKEGWTQDLSKVIRQATDAKLVKALADGIKSEDSNSPQLDAAVVAVVAEMNTNVILGHRKAAKSALDAMELAQAAVLSHGKSIKDIREAAVFAGAVESLSRTAKNVIEIERKAFNLDDDTPPEDETTTAARMSDTELAVRMHFLIDQAKQR